MRLLKLGSKRYETIRQWDEWIPRKYGPDGYFLEPDKATLLVGSEMTWWRDVRIVGDWALVAADSRGLLAIDLGNETSEMTMLAGFGRCTDITQVNGRTLLVSHDAESARLEEFYLTPVGEPRSRLLLAGLRGQTFVD